MKTKEEIQSKLINHLNAINQMEDDYLIILDYKTIETEKYYVFFYSNKKFMETKDFSFMIAGNAPIIIDKETENMHVTGTAHSIEYYLDEYEKQIK